MPYGLTMARLGTLLGGVHSRPTGVLNVPVPTSLTLGTGPPSGVDWQGSPKAAGARVPAGPGPIRGALDAPCYPTLSRTTTSQSQPVRSTGSGGFDACRHNRWWDGQCGARPIEDRHFDCHGGHGHR